MMVQGNAGVLTILLLVFALIGGSLTAPLTYSQREDDSAHLELLYDPDPVKDHISLNDDYGVKPMPVHLPPFLKSPYQPNLEDEYY